jgi:hypothetical protein
VLDANLLKDRLDDHVGLAEVRAPVGVRVGEPRHARELDVALEGRERFALHLRTRSGHF